MKYTLLPVLVTLWVGLTSGQLEEASTSTTSASPSTSTSPSLLDKMINIIRTPLHIDTLLDTHGVFSTQKVLSTFHTTFCPRSGTNQHLCGVLTNTVFTCIDQHKDCPEEETRKLLTKLVALQPCLSLTNGTAVHKICTIHTREAVRCIHKTKRGPCATGHVKYLLRKYRDFFNLPKRLIHIPRSRVARGLLD